MFSAHETEDGCSGHTKETTAEARRIWPSNGHQASIEDTGFEALTMVLAKISVFGM
jgi:hypothetical protein